MIKKFIYFLVFALVFCGLMNCDLDESIDDTSINEETGSSDIESDLSDEDLEILMSLEERAQQIINDELATRGEGGTSDKEKIEKLKQLLKDNFDEETYQKLVGTDIIEGDEIADQRNSSSYMPQIPQGDPEEPSEGGSAQSPDVVLPSNPGIQMFLPVIPDPIPYYVPPMVDQDEIDERIKEQELREERENWARMVYDPKFSISSRLCWGPWWCYVESKFWIIKTTNFSDYPGCYDENRDWRVTASSYDLRYYDPYTGNVNFKGNSDVMNWFHEYQGKTKWGFFPKIKGTAKLTIKSVECIISSYYVRDKLQDNFVKDINKTETCEIRQ